MVYVAPTLIRAQAAAAKLETTYGTDAVPGATTDAVRLSKAGWSSIEVDEQWPNLRDDAVNNQLIPVPAALAAGFKARVTLQVELAGGGATYSASVYTPARPLFDACGYPGVFSASPTPQWTQTPVGIAAARPSCSIYVWAGGRQFKLIGCRGDFEMLFRAGQLVQVTFTMEGILSGFADTAVPTATYTAVIPPAAIAQAVTIGAYAPDFDEIRYRGGARCTWLESGNATDGLQSYDYGEIIPTVRMTGRSVVGATYDPINDWDTATQRALALSWGVTQYNRGTLTDTGLYIPSKPTFSEKATGFTNWAVDYRCTAPALLFN